MNNTKLCAILLFSLSIAAFAWRNTSFKNAQTTPVLPIAGDLALLGGVTLLLAERWKSRRDLAQSLRYRISGSFPPQDSVSGPTATTESGHMTNRGQIRRIEIGIERG